MILNKNEIVYNPVSAAAGAKKHICHRCKVFYLIDVFRMSYFSNFRLERCAICQKEKNTYYECSVSQYNHMIKGKLEFGY